jgi:hypothetical protein
MKSDWRSRFFCYLALAVQVGLCGWYVQSQSTPLPVIDEWDQLETYFQHDSDSTPWVWQHHGDHRYPLTRWVWIQTLKLTGFRFHGPQFLTLAFFTSAAILSLWIARQRRGRQQISDVLFPALLLHFGHGITWTMSYQLGFGMVVNAFLGWLWTASHYERNGHRGWLLLNLIYLLMILPCGGFGVAMTPALVVWVLWLAWREGRWNMVRLGGILTAIAFISYTAWIVRTTPPVPQGFGATPWKEPGRFINCFAEFLACSFGTWTQVPEVYHAAHNKLMIGVPLGLTLFTTLLLFHKGWGVFRVAVLALVFGILLCAAAAAYRRPGAFLDRYIVFGAVAWIAIGLGFLRPNMLRQRAVTTLALLAAVALFGLNIRPGLFEAYRLREGTPAMLNAIETGRPPEVVSAQFVGLFSVQRYPGFSRPLALLRDAGIEPFRKLGANAKTQLVPIDNMMPLSTLDSIILLSDPPPEAIGVQTRCTATDGATNASVNLLLNRKLHDSAHPPYGPEKCNLIWTFAPGSTGLSLKPSHPQLAVTLDQWMWIVPSQPTN